MSEAQVQKDPYARFFDEMYEALHDSILIYASDEDVEFNYSERCYPVASQTIEARYGNVLISITHYDTMTQPYNAEAVVKGPDGKVRLRAEADGGDPYIVLESLKAKVADAIVAYVRLLASTARLIAQRAIRSGDRMVVLAAMDVISPHMVNMVRSMEDVAKALGVYDDIKRKIRSAERRLAKVSDELLRFRDETWPGMFDAIK